MRRGKVIGRRFALAGANDFEALRALLTRNESEGSESCSNLCIVAMPQM